MLPDFGIVTLKNDTEKPITVTLTINPGYSDAFEECNPQKAHTTGCIVVKELEHVHATLEKEKKKQKGRVRESGH